LGDGVARVVRVDLAVVHVARLHDVVLDAIELQPPAVVRVNVRERAQVLRDSIRGRRGEGRVGHGVRVDLVGAIHVIDDVRVRIERKGRLPTYDEAVAGGRVEHLIHTGEDGR